MPLKNIKIIKRFEILWKTNNMKTTTLKIGTKRAVRNYGKPTSYKLNPIHTHVLFL